MTPQPVAPQFTFDNFVVGPSNRLAAAAARRVADAPGRAYNPLFVHGPRGIGKTHLVLAIGAHAARVRPGTAVVYDTLEPLLEAMAAAFASGERAAFRRRLHGAELLIIDDVQFLAGQRAAQDELLRACDTLALRGGQLVLAGDRAPAEIEGLDDRLLSRFCGGLIVEVGVPDFETRVAILHRRAAQRGQRLSPELASALARAPSANVRELQGALNHALAAQELDAPAEPALDALAEPAPAAETAAGGDDEFAAFLGDLAGALDEAVAEVLDSSVGEPAVPDARAAEPAAPTVVPEPEAPDAAPPPTAPTAAPDLNAAPDPNAAGAAAPVLGNGSARPGRAGEAPDPWFLRRDKVIWDWPDPAAWLVEELD